jgi:hypothetical protein
LSVLIVLLSEGVDVLADVTRKGQLISEDDCTLGNIQTYNNNDDIDDNDNDDDDIDDNDDNNDNNNNNNDDDDYYRLLAIFDETNK